MSSDHLKIGFVRRGFSRSGGAEAYLKRLADGVVKAGHETQLFTTTDWPENEWPAGWITRIGRRSPIEFADELNRIRATADTEVLMSLERVWSCDVYRAGDGVHRAWMRRRAEQWSVWRRLAGAFNRKHAAMLRLEESLLRERRAGRVIANSTMVKDEIVSFYGYPAERIDVVPNGVSVEEYRYSPEQRERSRDALGLRPEDVAVLFVGSGWERKGLAHAVEAFEELHDPKLKLLVAGRGDAGKYRSRDAVFLGEVHDVAALYRAADMFLLPTLYDPFSNASLEALASGLPVITTKSNGFAEAMDDGVHGSILEKPAPDAIADAIRSWSVADRRAAARPLIVERAAQFDLSRNVARTLEILLQSATAVSTLSKMRNT
ncbi:glycosyltransferase family 4 protein [soil metagenome]